MRVAIFANDDLTSNIIFAPLFELSSIEIVAIRAAAGPYSKATSQFGGALRLLRKMAFRYWLFLAMSNGLFKTFEFVTLLFDRPPRSGAFVSLRAIARRRNLKVVRTLDFNSVEVEEQLRHLKVDLLLIRVGAILKVHVLSVPTHGTWCVHSSILPAFRGIAGEFHALRTSGAPVGSTVFEVTPELDGGPPLAQVAITRTASNTVFDHIIRNNEASGALLAALVNARARGEPLPASILNDGLSPSYFSWPTDAEVDAVRMQTSGLMSFRELMTCLKWLVSSQK